MKTLLALTMSAFLALPFTSSAQTTRDAKADALARAVMNASGAANWPKVKRIAFTFNVEENGTTLVSAKHDWDVRGGTDTVTWGGKTVTVKLSAPGASDDEKAAFQRWTNDSYWLLMPLKLRDSGLTLSYGGPKEVDGVAYETLDLRFADVGLTPGDRYTLYVDPETKRVRRWDYMPAPDKKIHGTWDKYETFGGLTLSTDHQFGGKRIFFTDVSVKE